MESQRIGILNYYYSNENYGAVLQAYALQEYLIALGYDAWIINFRNFPRRPDRALKVACRSYIFPNPFEKFRKKWLKLSKPYWWSVQLKDAGLNFDVFIVGSDQMWRADFSNTKVHLPHTAYYLSFVPLNKKRIAYGVSFGIDNWDVGSNIAYKNTVKQEIARFNAISVRETSGISICKRIFEVEAVQVLDPTLLVGRDYFDRIIDDEGCDAERDIVYYKLDTNKDFDTSIHYLSEELGCCAKNIYYSSVKNVLGENHFCYYDVDQWLKAIRDARLVVTDSFHCICFCLLFGKKFVYYPNQHRGMTRLESLLGMIDLTDRIFKSSEELKQRNSWRQTIDYDKVNRILDRERNKSVQFLENALH